MNLMKVSPEFRPEKWRLNAIKTGSYCELTDDAGRPLLVLVVGAREVGKKKVFDALLEHIDGRSQLKQMIRFNKGHVFKCL